MADPFFDPLSGNLLVEGLNRRTGQGEILKVNLKDLSSHPLTNTPKVHWSYPHVIMHDGQPYLMPEVAEWSAPALFPISDDHRLGAPIYLAGLETFRLLDPTYYSDGRTHFIFAGRRDFDPHGNLFLFYSESSIFGPYKPHLLNPIVSTPSGARMAGNLINTNDGLFRLGQDGAVNYGSYIHVFKVNDITKDAYSEQHFGKIRSKDWLGPHTLSFSDKLVAYDYYCHQFSPLAWLPRVRRAF